MIGKLRPIASRPQVALHRSLHGWSPTSAASSIAVRSTGIGIEYWSTIKTIKYGCSVRARPCGLATTNPGVPRGVGERDRLGGGVAPKPCCVIATTSPGVPRGVSERARLEGGVVSKPCCAIGDALRKRGCLVRAVEVLLQAFIVLERFKNEVRAKTSGATKNGCNNDTE